MNREKNCRDWAVLTQAPIILSCSQFSSGLKTRLLKQALYALYLRAN